MTQIISNLDLYKKQYPMMILEVNIDNLLLYSILRTQKLTFDFVINFILNSEYQYTEEEKYIDENIVVRYQPHLKNLLLNK